VRREIDPRNRRAILLHLTDEGASVRDGLRETRRRAAEDLFAPLSADDRETLAGLLTLLNSSGEPPGGN
jgi:DNA-binding MarR family transcriptional regulator